MPLADLADIVIKQSMQLLLIAWHVILFKCSCVMLAHSEEAAIPV